MSKDIRCIMIEKDNNLREFTQSVGYIMSRRMMKVRYDNSLSIDDVVEITDMSKKDYIELEYGESTQDKSIYDNVISKIKKRGDLNGA